MVTTLQLPPFPPPLPRLPQVEGAAASSDGAPPPADTPGRIEQLLARGIVTREDLVMAVILTASIPVGTERDVEVDPTSLSNVPVEFTHLTITEVDIAAPLLVAADNVRVRLFRQGTRRVPQDLVAQFDQTSGITGTWASLNANQRIEYTDLTGLNKVYLAIRNTAANSGPSPIEVRIYGRRFP